MENVYPRDDDTDSTGINPMCAEGGIDMFTAKELEELKKFDAKIEKEFILSPKEYWYSEGIDRQILRERKGIYRKKRKSYEEYGKQYYKDHRDYMLKRAKEYQQEHKERLAYLKKGWYQAKKERILANRKEK